MNSVNNLSMTKYILRLIFLKLTIITMKILDNESLANNRTSKQV